MSPPPCGGDGIEAPRSGLERLSVDAGLEITVDLELSSVNEPISVEGSG